MSEYNTNVNTWNSRPLSEIVECLDGQRRPVKKDDRNNIVGKYPYYGASGIIDYVNDYIFDGDYILLGEDGENVVSRNLPLAFKITGKNWVNNHAHVLKPKQNYNIDFLVYILEYHDYKDIVSGSAQPKINQKNLMKIDFLVPNETQQKKIAQILTTCDSVIEQTQAAIEKYKAIKQGMLHDLFTRGLTASGQLRPTPQQAPELYKHSELGLIPKEWEVKRLEEISTMKSGDGITSENISAAGDYPVFGGNGLRGFTSTYTHEGDYVLIGRQGALCGNITRVSNKFFASEHAVVVTHNQDVDVDWLAQMLESMNLNQYSEASAQPGLAVTKILRLFIVKPKYSEQKEIGKRLISIDTKLQSEEALLSKYQSIKKGLMSDLLSGKREV